MKIITKILSNSKIKRFCLLILLLILYIFISAISYTNAVCSDISQNVFRLHIIANSDSEQDQNLKYIVRDKVLSYISKISKGASTKEEVVKIVQSNLNEIQSIAIKTIQENGFNYSVTVEVGNFSFPIKKYGDITLPPGYYDALRIKIGDAAGHNWWCVLYPSLCFVDSTHAILPKTSKDKLRHTLTLDEYNYIIKSPNTKVTFTSLLSNLF